MSGRSTFRTIRGRALARFCAGAIIALVLCPFTAPFASYDPNASAIGLLTQDGSLVDKACDKAVSVAASAVAAVGVVPVEALGNVRNAHRKVDLLLQRSMVLRV